MGDPRVTAELEYIFRWLRENGHHAVGFGTDDGNFTWVVMVRPTKRAKEDRFWEMLFDAWDFGVASQRIELDDDYPLYRAFQLPIAIETVLETTLPAALPRWVKTQRFRNKMASK